MSCSAEQMASDVVVERAAEVGATVIQSGVDFGLVDRQVAVGAVGVGQLGVDQVGQHVVARGLTPLLDLGLEVLVQLLAQTRHVHPAALQNAFAFRVVGEGVQQVLEGEICVP